MILRRCVAVDPNRPGSSQSRESSAWQAPASQATRDRDNRNTFGVVGLDDLAEVRGCVEQPDIPDHLARSQIQLDRCRAARFSRFSFASAVRQLVEPV